MAAEKVALLLLPGDLDRSHVVLSSLHIVKTAKSIDLQEHDLSPLELRKFYSDLPKELRDCVVRFCFENINDAQQAVKQRLAQQKAGVSREAFVQNAMLRHLHHLFESVKPFASLVKWYHKISEGKGKFRTAPCVFSAYKPMLNFEVKQDDTGLFLITYVVLNGANFNLNEFTRHSFLLQSNNEYFILSVKDFQTLDWLEDNDGRRYAHDALGFSQVLLGKLEGDYPVNRNDLFSKKEIRKSPANRLMLSELSNSFLMLTPQWLYDGLLVEGPWKESFNTVVEGEEYAVYRDEKQERSFIDLLESLHPNFAKQRNGYYYLPFADAQRKQWFLKAYHKILDLGIELTGMDMLQHFRYSAHKANTSVTIKSEGKSNVVLELSVYFGPEKVELKSLQKMLLSGQKAVLLKDSSLGVLSDEWMQQYATIIKHGSINKDEVEVAKFLAISEQQSTKEQRVLTPLVKEQWWQKWQQWQNSDSIIYQVPASVNATLRPYQQKGFEWLTLLAEAGAGGCLADDMGLGKTMQTICFLAHHIQQYPGSTSIIVCPSSLIYNWQQELQKFAPGITSMVYHGIGRNAEDLDKDVRVVITSYGTIRADAAPLLAKSYGVAVIDESHNIKNPSAQITSVVSLLNAVTRVALSGTPVVNNTFDLYAQLNFALPGMFGSREFFKREYADAIDRNHDEEKIKELQKLTAPFILRRTKEQVAKDLPDKTETILWCNMHRDQQNLYNEIKDQIRGSLFLDIKSNGLGKSKLAVIQGMLKLRQICNSPLLLPVDEQQNCSQSVKTEVLIQELKNILGEHKALVFSQFSTMLNLLARDLDKQGISYYHFDGQTPPAKRAEMVNAFQEKENKTHLFLISLKAGNTGLTLTAADYVFLFDPWWNTAVEQQAIDRTHRIGQTKNVFAYKIICKNTIEEKIIQLQQRKKKLAEELVTEDDGFIKALNEEDIAYLFS
jgi:SNF2 family DNA or RNA helicase